MVAIKSVQVRVEPRIKQVLVGTGLPGPTGVSITDAVVNGSGHLILTLSNGDTIDAGYIVGPPGPISSLTETGNGIIIDNAVPTAPVLSLDATLEAVANFATGANKVMVWSGTDTLTSFDVDTDVTLAANSDTRFATQKAVKAYADALIAANDAMVFKGSIDASTNPNYPAADRGHTWRISVAGKIGGASGTNVEAGDLIICLTDGSVAGTQAAVGANWTISQTNLDGAVIGPASSTDAAIAGFNGTTGKLIKVLTATEIRVAAVLATTDSPQFAGINLGHATDTTLTRLSAGQAAVEGVQVLTASNSVVVSNKLFEDSTNSFVDVADNTKRVQLAADLVDASTTRVLTSPNKSGVIVLDPTAVTDIPPTLDLALTHFDGAPFDDYFSRSGAGGYRLNSKGVLVPTVSGEPVIDFGSDGKPRGTGFYGAYTNLFKYSEQFDHTDWAKTNITVAANSVIALDGNLTADSLTRASNAVSLMQQGVALSVGNTITFSIFAKAKSVGNRIGMRIQGTYPDRVDAIFDLSTGLLVGAAAVTFTGLSTAIENVGGGWYRLSLTATITGTALTSVLLGPCDSSQVVAGWEAASATLSDCYVWGAQLTATAFPVPYVPTTSAAVARSAADLMTIAGAEFSDFFNVREGSFLAEFIAPTTLTIQVIFGFGDGTFANSIYANILSGGVIRLESGGSVGALVSGPSNTGAMTKLAVSYSASAAQLAVNGASFTPDTALTLPTATRMSIGSNPWDNANPLNGHIRRLIYWPKALSATELVRMTA